MEISWDEHLIPSITAASDVDAAYSIGVAHAHLRLAQMELFRKVSHGRISEMAGPFTIKIDEAIRAIDLDRAVEEIERDLPERTRVWIEAYVKGVNAYRERLRRRPADAAVLGIEFKEPWTVRDVLVFGRLASVDVNWGRWLTLAGLRDENGYEDFVNRLWDFGDMGLPSFGPGQPHELDTLTDIGRTGSNAFVVHGSRSRSGGALVASDPHLGLLQPNIWCVIGYRTPESSVVGLTIPGLPFVLVGRNEQVAWTGTNMQSSSSVLYRLPSGWEAESTRSESISVRLWPDATRSIRESVVGPVITDAGLLRPLDEGDVALRWRGHDGSDESSAFLRASRSLNWTTFRDAFDTYAAGGQNILYGDADGNIGQLMAVEAVPAAARASRLGVVDVNDPLFAWSDGLGSSNLPASFNPEAGFLVSANNVPTPMRPVLVPQGNANDRISRMSDLLSGSDFVSLDDLARIQSDTFSAASLELAQRVTNLAESGELTSPARSMVRELASWDGQYSVDSRGAYVYQLILSHLIDGLYSTRYGEGIRATIRSGPYVHDFILADLLDPASTATVIAAIRAADRDARSDSVWGDIHELRVAHPIGAVPLLGRGYVFDRTPYSGSTSVVAKAAHAVTAHKHSPRFGAIARLLLDMGTADNNRVVLLGGQDGWIGSDRMLDMVPLWTEGRFIPLPISADGQASRSRVRTSLIPE
ncbi:MAG: penicillin acylase family protein [Planctomycetota bacterium]